MADLDKAIEEEILAIVEKYLSRKIQYCISRGLYFVELRPMHEL